MATAAIANRPAFTQLVSTTIDIESRADTLKATYWLLLGSVAFAFLGGYVGLQTDVFVDFFSTTIGIVVGIVLLNVIPMFALAAVSRPGIGVLVLGLDGFLSGIVISPLLHMAENSVPDSIPIAIGLTAVIFGSITAYIMFTRKTFSAPRALTFGIFASITAVVLLGTQIHLGTFGIVISAVIAVFGIILLVSNTSRVLLSPLEIGAVPGALMLFAGIFNVFVGLLRIVMLVMSGGRRR